MMLRMRFQGSKRPFKWGKYHINRPADGALRTSTDWIRTGRHRDVLDVESVVASGALTNVGIQTHRGDVYLCHD